jgi:hypothetical protein
VKQASADDLAAIERFNPVMTYTMETAGLRELLLRFAPPYFWRGRVYKIHSKPLGAGVHHVWCELEP